MQMGNPDASSPGRHPPGFRESFDSVCYCPICGGKIEKKSGFTVSGMKRELLVLILTLFFLLPSCTAKEEGRCTLSFAVGGAPVEIEFWERSVAEFTKKTGIPVTIRREPTDTDQRRQELLIPLKAKKADPDVFLMDVAWISQFAASGWLLPLDDLGKEVGLEHFFDRVLNLVDRYDGALVALPVYLDGGLLYYRSDLLQKFGYEKPPATWEELVQMSLRVQKEMRKDDPSFYGFVWQGAQYEGLICNFIEVAASGGGGIALSDKRISLNTPENRNALNFMRKLIHTYRVSPPNTYTEMKEEEVRIHFQKGKALFERNWPYAWMIHEQGESRVKGKTAIAPLPHFEPGVSVSTLGGWHIGISRHTDAREEALELVKFVLSFDTQKQFALKLGWNSGRTDIYDDPEILKALPHQRELKMIFTHTLPRPIIPYYTQISAVIQENVNGALSGQMNPEDALARAERESQKIIDRYEAR